MSVKPRGKLSHSSYAAGQYLLLLSVNTLFHVAEVCGWKNASLADWLNLASYQIGAQLFGGSKSDP